MLFNSYEFLFLFLPATFFLYFALSRKKLVIAAKAWLILASLFFYSWWNISYLPIILVSIIANYAVGASLSSLSSARTKLRKSMLISGIVFNLLLLGYYKYFAFFVLNANALLGTHWAASYRELPLGISFFTFTQIAYLVDTYRGQAKETSYENYSLFVAFFPHLLAGPIIHHRAVMPQFDRLRNHLIQHKNIFLGLFYFLIGLFQKVVIADYVGPIANLGFLNAHLLSAIEAWGALLAYALQIYFDFAGYSNMAIGLALVFNIRFPVNFNSPYQATSIIDFWRRWHMTLSQFLRDYLYIPLGGNRGGELLRYRNIMMTMLLGGLWHGAGWTFVFWGGYHGLLIVLNHGIQKFKVAFPKFLSILITFFFVCYGWVFFKATDIGQARAMTRGLFGLQGVRFTNFPFLRRYDLFAIAFLCLIAWFCPNVEFWVKKIRPSVLWLLLFVLVFLADILFLNRASAFLYFQF